MGIFNVTMTEQAKASIGLARAGFISFECQLDTLEGLYTALTEDGAICGSALFSHKSEDPRVRVVHSRMPMLLTSAAIVHVVYPTISFVEEEPA